MEPIASHYAVLLHDDRLRRTLVKGVSHTNRRPWPLRIPYLRARLHLAEALRALAARIEANPRSSELAPDSRA
jgi:hypothetical protein